MKKLLLLLLISAAAYAQTLTVNTTWSASPITITEDVIVPAGITLTINAGVMVNFLNSSSLIVNGTLKVNGTSASKVTLDFQTPNANGIGVTSTATGVSVVYANIKNASTGITILSNENTPIINYCDFGYCGKGIGLSSTNAEVTNSTFHNLSDIYIGIYTSTVDCLYHPTVRKCTLTGVGYKGGIDISFYAHPKIFENTITGSSPYEQAFGIAIRYWSEPEIEKNKITISGGKGIHADSWGEPILGSYQYYAHEVGNTIKGNLYGIYAEMESDVDAGYTNTGSSCYNSIYNNTYNAYVIENASIMAQYCWWGNYPPITAKFYVESGSYLYYGEYLDYNYNSSISGGVAGEKGVAVAASTQTNSLIANSNNYAISKQYDKAVETYKDIISSESDYSSIAFRKLGSVYLESKDETVLNYIKNFVSPEYENSVSYLRAVKTLMKISGKEGRFGDLLAYSDILINKSEIPKEKASGLMTKFYIYYAQKEYDRANSIYETLKTDYTESPDVSNAAFLLNAAGYNPDAVKGPNVINNENETPAEYGLLQNYPNPFNPSTVINYNIPEDGMVSLKVYDMLGREIAALVNEHKTAGKYSANFNASNLSTGIYFYELRANNYISVKKMSFVK